MRSDNVGNTDELGDTVFVRVSREVNELVPVTVIVTVTENCSDELGLPVTRIDPEAVTVPDADFDADVENESEFDAEGMDETLMELPTLFVDVRVDVKESGFEGFAV